MRVSARAVVLNGDNLLVMDRNKFGNKYVSLCGGKVEVGETPDQAVVREVREETTLEVANPKLVIIEEAGEVYGTHYIYVCEYKGGEIKLDPNSPEYKINQLGQNIYTPMWVNKKDLPNINLLPVKLKENLIDFLNNGFPDQPINLSAKE